MRFTPPLAISPAEIDEAILRFPSPLESETIAV
jgi:acetylornithine/succinyldiaminopimelate/putrescine aminotransferase